MRELQDHNSLGTLYEDEAIVVISDNIHLIHDTIKSGSVYIYSDEAHTIETTEFSLTFSSAIPTNVILTFFGLHHSSFSSIFSVLSEY